MTQEIISADAGNPPARSADRAAPFAPGNSLSMSRLLGQPAVRSAIPALAGGGAIALAAIAWWGFQSPPQRPLFQDLADGDKAAVADALQSAGIAHQIDSGTGSVTVGEDDIHRARILLAGQGLPKAAPSSSAVMASLPMGSSRAVEGEALRSARESDLARTVEAVDAVKSARVHLAVPEPSVFVRDASAPVASVMLTLRPGRVLSEAQVRAIKHLVAASVPGMAPDQVTVIDQAGTLLSQPGTNGENDAFQLQTQMEERYRQSLIALLTPVTGAGNFSAQVRIELDQSESQSTRESYPKDDRALISEQGTRSSGASASVPPAIGIPGALSNQPPPASQLSTQPSPATATPPATSASSAPSEENFSRRFDVGREISVTHQPVGRVRRISVAVAVRDVKGGKPRSAKELAALDSLVKGAVGFDAARGDVVAITSRPFAESDIEEAAFWEAPWFMPAMRQIGALLAALLVFFFIGRPLVRGIKTRLEAVAPALPAYPSVNSGQAQLQPGAITIDMIESAPSYAARAELVRDFVRQDPKRASLVVRNLVQEGANG